MRLRAGSWYSVEASHVSVGYTILTVQEMLLLLCLHNYSIFSMHCWLSLSLSMKTNSDPRLARPGTVRGAGNI